MSNEFQEKLQLYKEGKLNQNEAEEIECEIDKYIAITDYLQDDDKAFLEELKQQMPGGNEYENRLDKLLKRSVNLRIIMMTVISVFSAFCIIVFFYFTTSNIVTTLFGLSHEEAFIKREVIVQLAKMFLPQYEHDESSVSKLLFAQQNISVSLNNTVGHTLIDETEISVRYSFGRPVRSKTSTSAPPVLEIENFSFLNGRESDPISGFKVLENAPQGTKAKVLIEFNKSLTPKQLNEQLINQISTADTGTMEIRPLVVIGSRFIISNPSFYQLRTIYPFGKKNAKQYEDYSLKQNQYENMDDQAHKESLIGNLNLIKNNQRLLTVMYYEDMFEVINIDDIIKHVENNGVEYIGVYVSADSKELLKLKGNPMIHSLQVDNIVLW